MTADLRQTLADLGNTPDAVADRLRSLGIKGKRVSADACPVAHFLNRHGFSGASINRLTALVDNPAANFVTLEVGTPWPVATFIRRFDAGVHLDLVEVAG